MQTITKFSLFAFIVFFILLAVILYNIFISRESKKPLIPLMILCIWLMLLFAGSASMIVFNLGEQKGIIYDIISIFYVLSVIVVPILSLVSFGFGIFMMFNDSRKLLAILQIALPLVAILAGGIFWFFFIKLFGVR